MKNNKWLKGNIGHIKDDRNFPISDLRTQHFKMPSYERASSNVSSHPPQFFRPCLRTLQMRCPTRREILPVNI